MLSQAINLKFTRTEIKFQEKYIRTEHISQGLGHAAVQTQTLRQRSTRCKILALNLARWSHLHLCKRDLTISVAKAQKKYSLTSRLYKFEGISHFQVNRLQMKSNSAYKTHMWFNKL
jgi:hypothetical protein